MAQLTQPLNPILVDILIRQRQNDLPRTIQELGYLQQASKTSGQSVGQLTNAANRMGYVFKEDGSIVSVYSGKIAEQGKVMQDATRQLTRFKMHYLSLMFAGILVSRTTDKFMRDTISTMMKMTEGQSQSAQALLSLTASWEYLKFSIGDAIGTALEPVLPYIIAIVDGFADFVQQNPEATFTAIFGLLAAGTTLMAIGQIGMFMQGLAMWKASPELTNFTAAGGGMDKLVKFAQQGVGVALIFKGFNEKDSDIGLAIQDSLSGAGLLLLTAGKGKEAAILMGIGFAFHITKDVFEGKMTSDDILNALIKATGLALQFQPTPQGKAVGLALVLLPSISWSQILGPPGTSYPFWMQPNWGMTTPKQGDDFIITKSGQFIQTSPQDTIYASKTGMSGVSVGAINITISTNTITSENKDQLAREIGDKIVDEIKRYHR